MDTANSSDLAARILDTAIALAEERSWESIRLHEVAAAAGISLDDIRRHFREKDELIDAWFDRADAAMLGLAAEPEMGELSARQRLRRLVLGWLDALEPHHRVTRQMILAKCEPGHFHIQIPALMRISRTVQWMREGALLQDGSVRRAIAETVTTSIYLATFVCWLSDDTVGSQRAVRLLDRLLCAAEQAALAIPGFATTGTAPRRDDTAQSPAGR
jgi:AcrR family transcriptional regulator